LNPVNFSQVGTGIKSTGGGLKVDVYFIFAHCVFSHGRHSRHSRIRSRCRDDGCVGYPRKKRRRCDPGDKGQHPADRKGRPDKGSAFHVARLAILVGCPTQDQRRCPVVGHQRFLHTLYF